MTGEINANIQALEKMKSQKEINLGDLKNILNTANNKEVAASVFSEFKQMDKKKKGSDDGDNVLTQKEVRAYIKENDEDVKRSDRKDVALNKVNSLLDKAITFLKKDEEYKDVSNQLSLGFKNGELSIGANGVEKKSLAVPVQAEENQPVAHKEGIVANDPAHITNVYEVKSGDTLYVIAREVLRKNTGKEPTSAEIKEQITKIANDNGIKNINRIKTGQKLVLDGAEAIEIKKILRGANKAGKADGADDVKNKNKVNRKPLDGSELGEDFVSALKNPYIHAKIDKVDLNSNNILGFIKGVESATGKGLLETLQEYKDSPVYKYLIKNVRSDIVRLLEQKVQNLGIVNSAEARDLGSKFFKILNGSLDPREVDSKLDALVDNMVKVEQKDKKEALSRKGHNVSFTENKYNTYQDVAKSAFAREGNKTPTKHQIDLRVKDLKALNPKIADNNIKGHKINVNYNKKTYNEIIGNSKKRSEAKVATAKNKAMKIGKQLAEYMNGSGYILSIAVNSENVIDILNGYKKNSKEGLISQMSKSQDFVKKQPAVKVLNALLDRAKNKGLGGSREYVNLKKFVVQQSLMVPAQSIDTKALEADFNRLIEKAK